MYEINTTNYTMNWNEEVDNTIGQTTIKYNKERHFRNHDCKELSIRIELYDDCLSEGCESMEIDRECDIHTFVNIYLPHLKPNSAKAVKCKYDGREFELERQCDEAMITALHNEIDYCSNAYFLYHFI